MHNILSDFQWIHMNAIGHKNHKYKKKEIWKHTSKKKRIKIYLNYQRNAA